MRTTPNNTDNTEKKKTQNVAENDQVCSQQRSRLTPVKLAKEKRVKRVLRSDTRRVSQFSSVITMLALSLLFTYLTLSK